MPRPGTRGCHKLGHGVEGGVGGGVEFLGFLGGANVLIYVRQCWLYPGDKSKIVNSAISLGGR